MQAGIPHVFVNHFDNQRLAANRISRWLDSAAGLGGVSAQNVPAKFRERFVNLSDAIDTAFFSPEQAKPVRRFGGQVLLLPARVAPEKGHHDLLLAAKILLDAREKFHVVFAGAVDSPALAEELKKTSTTLGLDDRVHFLGGLTRGDLRDLYAASDIVVLPSHSEGLGRVLVEGQAMQVSVVAYRTGGMPDAMQDGITGLLAEERNPQDLAARLGELLRDSKRRSEMGRAGREFVMQSYSIEALTRRHEEFYLRAVGQTRESRPSAASALSLPRHRH
jgi:D-inositol-3-phosphate glycosyltransferase